MPIVVHLDHQLTARGVTLTELAQRVGITLANLSVLKTGKARAIRFSTLEAVCRELDCQPGDLLTFEPAAVAAQDQDEAVLREADQDEADQAVPWAAARPARR